MKSHKRNKPSAKAAPSGASTRSAGTDIGILEPQRDRTRWAASTVSDDTHAILELTEKNFAASINGHPFVAVDFCAPSSVPCRAFAPTFAAAAARNPDVLFARVDIDDQQAIGAQFGIRSTPTLMIFRSNIIVYAKAGLLEAKALDETLVAVRALDMEEVRQKVARVNTVALGTPVASTPMAPTAGVDAQTTGDPSLLSIEDFLHPSLRGPGSALMGASPRLATGGLVVIRDAFHPDFAERMYRSLDGCANWPLHENYAKRFAYHHHNLYHAEQFPADVAWCSKVFDSSASKAWATRLSGRPCPGPTEISASCYLPGDHSLPHNDNVTTGKHYIRQLAFVWHLAKDWRSEWGGAFFWIPKASYLPPAFNTLYLFNVGPDSTHCVTQVSPYARAKRLVINGWWTGMTPTGDAAWKGPERIGTGSTEILVY